MPLGGIDPTFINDLNFWSKPRPSHFPYPVNLIASAYVDVICPSVSADQYASNNRGNVLARFYVDVPYGSMYQYQPQIQNPMQFTLKDLTTLELRLIDEYGDPISMPPNQVVSYTFNLTIQQAVSTMY
jgi:hypothetical protein